MRTMIRRWVKWGLLAFARKSSWLGKSHYEAVRCGQARAGRPVQVKDMEHLLQWRQDGEPQDLDGAERVLRELVPDERTRRVLFGRFVLEQSLTEIGRDVGLTASMVSRIVARCDKQG
jgi:hypothetical protein